MHDENVIREMFKRYMRNDCRYLNPNQRSAILSKYDESVKAGCEPLTALGIYLEEYGQNSADEVLTKYHATAGLLNDKEKTRYREWQERVSKKWKMDKLSLVGMDETPVAPTPTKDTNLKSSPEIAIGHSKQVRFNNKTIIFAIEIR
jgi:hypothetical protein